SSSCCWVPQASSGAVTIATSNRVDAMRSRRRWFMKGAFCLRAPRGARVKPKLHSAVCLRRESHVMRAVSCLTVVHSGRRSQVAGSTALGYLATDEKSGGARLNRWDGTGARRLVYRRTNNALAEKPSLRGEQSVS